MNFQLMKKNRKTLYTMIIILAFVSSLYILTGRILAEKKNRVVEIAMDFKDLEDSCRQENIPTFEALEKLKFAGLTSVSFSEVSLEDLQSRGRLRWMNGSQLIGILNMGAAAKENINAIKPGSIYVFDYSPETGLMLKRNFQTLVGPGSIREVKLISKEEKTLNALEITSISKDTPYLGTGFDEELITNIHNMGFHIVLRPENRPSFDDKVIKAYLGHLNSIKGVTTIIFGGTNEVLGFPLSLDTTVESLKNTSAAFGDIEVPNVKAKQKGAEYLGLRLCDKTVRVQSISPQYLAKMTPEDSIDIFRLGVRERNIRFIYLRPYPRGINGKSFLATNLDYVGGLKKNLERYNFAAGPASRFPLMNPPAFLVVLITLGAAAAFMLLLNYFYEERGIEGTCILTIAFVFSILLILMGKMYLVQKITGLAIGVIFPVYAFAASFKESGSSEIVKRFSSVFFFALKRFAQITMITLMGSFMIAAVFSSTVFLLAVNGFSGVKVIMILPPLLIVLIYYMEGTRVKQSIRDLFKQPIFLWQVTTLGILGAIGAFYILRTGNITETPALDMERQVRIMLDQLLWVRPRFKDFLIGHPAMILAWALFSLQKFTGLGLFFLFSGIGQADIIDTFAHVHTPIFISLIRVLNGCILGAVIGMLALSIYWLISAKIKTKS